MSYSGNADAAGGLFRTTKTNLVLPGIMPLTVTRTYRTNSSSTGPFGIGTSWNHDLFLTPPPNGSPDQLRLLIGSNTLNLASFHQGISGHGQQGEPASRRSEQHAQRCGAASAAAGAWRYLVVWASAGSPLDKSADAAILQGRTRVLADHGIASHMRQRRRGVAPRPEAEAGYWTAR